MLRYTVFVQGSFYVKGPSNDLFHYCLDASQCLKLIVCFIHYGPLRVKGFRNSKAETSTPQVGWQIHKLYIML